MNKDQVYLVVDTETGGLNPRKNSILSIAGVVWEPKKSITPIFDFYICEPKLNYVDKAMEVNRIDLEDVKNGLKPFEAVQEIKRSLGKYFGHARQPIMLVGHNINFDIAFIKRLYRLAKLEYYVDFRNRALDTAAILEFLMISGKIEGDRASADVLFEATNTKIREEDRHTAKGDAIATATAIDTLTLTI